VTAKPPADRSEVDGAWAQSARIAFRFLFIAVAVIAAGWGVSNIRQVPPESRAVVLRFGSVVRQQGAGLLIAWPRPIEEVVTLPSGDQQIEFEISRFDSAGRIYHTSVGGKAVTTVPLGQAASAAAVKGAFEEYTVSRDPRMNAGFLLTGDFSVVHLQATLFYQINDPVRYLIAAEHVAPALQRLFIASAVSVCAARDLDSILVARPEASSNPGDALRPTREQLRTDLVNAVNRRLQELADQGVGFGIKVSRVDLVPAIPSGAKAAFDSVLVATQTAEANIADARTAAEVTAQQANSESDRIVAEATAQAQEQVTEATTRTAAIAALEQQSPGLSKQMLVRRLYYDRVGTLLKRAGEVDTIDRDGGSHVIVPGPDK
jgi:regulator of protease activity HflC (stomatin/prohibitin superfamily)